MEARGFISSEVLPVRAHCRRALVRLAARSEPCDRRSVGLGDADYTTEYDWDDAPSACLPLTRPLRSPHKLERSPAESATGMPDDWIDTPGCQYLLSGSNSGRYQICG